MTKSTVTISGGGKSVTMDAGTLARVAKQIGKDREPKPRGGAQQTFGFDTTHGFLGEEFLTYLWWKWETEGGEFIVDTAASGSRVVGVMLDDVLAFAPAADGETQITLRQGMPTKAPEARTALRQGHRLAKARLIIAEGSSTWSVTLTGENLTLGAVNLPEDAEDCESAEDRTTDRVGNWFALQDILAKLFARFAGVRLGPDWTTEAQAMASWMAS